MRDKRVVRFLSMGRIQVEYGYLSYRAIQHKTRLFLTTFNLPCNLCVSIDLRTGAEVVDRESAMNL